MSDSSFDIPVLLLGFNRPDLARQVLEALRQVRPTRLYIAVDGPRPNAPEEAKQCQAMRQLAETVDWPCQLQTLFQTSNLGCRLGPPTAISWFFEQESEGIILEDDCLPSRSFFPYCASLLARYRDDTRVTTIAGAHLRKNSSASESYHFSRYPHIWGWATWRRAWQHYDLSVSHWPVMRDRKLLSGFFPQPAVTQHWHKVLEHYHSHEVNTWDVAWMFTSWSQNGLCATPSVNLISNIGFGQEATHTGDSDSWMSNLARKELSLPLTHPPVVMADAQADWALFKDNFQIPWLKRMEYNARVALSPWKHRLLGLRQH